MHAAHADEAARDIVLARIDRPAFAQSVESRQRVLAEEEWAMTSLVADAVMGRRPDTGIDGLWTAGEKIDGRAWGQLKEVIEATVRPGGSELSRQTLLSRQRRLCDIGAALAGRWADMDLTGRRSVIDAVVDHFVVLPAPRVRNQFHSERLRPVWRD